MESIIQDNIDPADLKKYELLYNEQFRRGYTSEKTQFDYAWCLIRSRYQEDMKKGVALLEGLRKLSTPPKKPKGLSNAEKCKRYREALKTDPARDAANREKNLERARRSYYRPRTEEELEIRRAKDRERKRAYRALQKDVCAVQVTPQPKPKTRSSIASQRQAWVQTQKKSRERWSSQKWRRHRERCRQYYYKIKSEKDLLKNEKEDISKRDYLYYIAVGHTRLKEYEKALKYIDAVTHIEPANHQAKQLHTYIKKKMEKDGLVGMAIVGGAAVVLGGLVTLGIAALKK